MSEKPEGRLIDANALFNAFESVGWFDNADRELAEYLILGAHTIDAVPMDEHRKCLEAEIEKRILTEKTNRQILENYAPVVHAKWIKHYIKIGNFDWKYKCSMCGKFNKQYSPPYCPHCGAKMDEGEDDENS